MSTNPKINHLHKLYCDLTGMRIGLQFNREHSWHDFLRAGFTAEQLEWVVGRLKRLISEGERRPECLKFSNLIEMLDKFEEEVAMVRAEEEGLVPKKRELSVFELTKIVEAKQSMVDVFGLKHSKYDGFRHIFDTPEHAKEYRHQLKEIQAIREKIASMA